MVERKTIRLSVALSPATKEKIYRLAKLNGYSVNEYILQILEVRLSKDEKLIERLDDIQREFEEKRNAVLKELACNSSE